MLVTKAERREPRGEVADVVVAPKARAAHRRHPRCTPARGGKTRRHWPRVPPLGPGGLLGFGQGRGPPDGRFPPQAVAASDPTPAPPLVHGRACETPRQRDVRPALPRSEGHDGEPALDGVHLAQRLGGVQWTVEGLTRASGDRQTTGAPGASPLRKSACPVGRGEYPAGRSHVKPSSHGINHVSVPQKIDSIKVYRVLSPQDNLSRVGGAYAKR